MYIQIEKLLLLYQLISIAARLVQVKLQGVLSLRITPGENQPQVLTAQIKASEVATEITKG